MYIASCKTFSLPLLKSTDDCVRYHFPFFIDNRNTILSETTPYFAIVCIFRWHKFILTNICRITIHDIHYRKSLLLLPHLSFSNRTEKLSTISTKISHINRRKNPFHATQKLDDGDTNDLFVFIFVMCLGIISFWELKNVVF